MALQGADEAQGLKPEDFERVAQLVKRLTKTTVMQEICTEDESVSSTLDTALTEQYDKGYSEGFDDGLSTEE